MLGIGAALLGFQGDFKVACLAGLSALWLVVWVGRREVGVSDHGVVTEEFLLRVVARGSMMPNGCLRSAVQRFRRGAA